MIGSLVNNYTLSHKMIKYQETQNKPNEVQYVHYLDPVLENILKNVRTFGE